MVCIRLGLRGSEKMVQIEFIRHDLAVIGAFDVKRVFSINITCIGMMRGNLSLYW